MACIDDEQVALINDSGHQDLGCLEVQIKRRLGSRHPSAPPVYGVVQNAIVHEKSKKMSAHCVGCGNVALIHMVSNKTHSAGARSSSTPENGARQFSTIESPTSSLDFTIEDEVRRTSAYAKHFLTSLLSRCASGSRNHASAYFSTTCCFVSSSKHIRKT